MIFKKEYTYENRKGVIVLYIELKELCIYRQYVEFPVVYYFDRKTYTILHYEKISAYDEPYERYIPLFRIDKTEIENNFIIQLNNKRIMNDYKKSKRDLYRFCEIYGLVDLWMEYFYQEVEKVAIEWCKKNNICYRK